MKLNCGIFKEPLQRKLEVLVRQRFTLRGLIIMLDCLPSESYRNKVNERYLNKVFSLLDQSWPPHIERCSLPC
jgi:hypothetical protein